MSPAIRIDGLGKRYRLGLTHPGSLRAWAEHAFRRALEMSRWSVESVAAGTAVTTRRQPADRAKLWALRDVTGEIAPGEVLGLVGRNGAGKSTLCKILSRVTRPTEGRAEIHGRVGSLLEVGTGFHPELTGRENIYLNGAILGMTRADVRRQFEPIVGFSGVERFLDTPLKRYSSGMKVRLGFAVAAHLDPEILIVDEVLAVGDAEFQKRCLGKMQEVAGGGRTVLFVSHNLSAVRQLCSTAWLLDGGRLLGRGETAAVLDQYRGRLAEDPFPTPQSRQASRAGFAECSITAARLCDPQGESLSSLAAEQDLCVEMVVFNRGPGFDAALGMSIETADLVRVIGDYTRNRSEAVRCDPGENVFRVHLAQPPLNEGWYFVTLAVHDFRSSAVVHRVDQCLSFELLARRADGLRRSRRSDGILLWPCRWTRCSRETAHS